MLFKKKKTCEDRYGKYPCNDYLNNALRVLLKDQTPNEYNKHAIQEICLCIHKAGGYFVEDNAKKLAETGLCPYVLQEDD